MHRLNRSCFLALLFCSGLFQIVKSQDQSATTESPGTTASIDQSTPQQAFHSFANAYNEEQRVTQLKLISPKTKAILAYSHMHRLMMSRSKHRALFKSHTQRWQKTFDQFYAASSIDIDDHDASLGPIANELSQWVFLDEYLLDLFEVIQESVRPNYSTELIDLKMDADKASGEFRIRTRGGIVDSLTGNSSKWIDAGVQEIYFVKMDGDWFVCNQDEFDGKFEK